MNKAFWQWMFKVTGWQIIGEYPREIRKGIIVLGPHTSNWDFLLGYATRAVEQFPSYFLIKDEWIHKPLIGSIVKKMGGVCVDRSKKKNRSTSRQIIDEFNNREEFVITITPEGTRKYNGNWRTGFWYIAREADVPLIPASVDYSKKLIVWHEPFSPTNKEADIEKLKNIFRQYKGRFPEQGVK